jgi:hypothetical protein
MGGSGGWVGERGSLVKVDANGAEGQSLLSSGVIKEELMDLARAAASEEVRPSKYLVSHAHTNSSHYPGIQS